MSTYTFKDDTVSIKQIIEDNYEDDDMCILIENAGKKFALLVNTYYYLCKGINRRFKFEKLNVYSSIVNGVLFDAYNDAQYHRYFMIHQFKNDDDYELFKGSIKQWILQTDKIIETKTKTKVIIPSYEDKNTKPTSPKKKKTSLEDYMSTLEVDSEEYKKLYTKYIEPKEKVCGYGIVW